MEYLKKGSILSKNYLKVEGINKNKISIEKAKKYFQDILLGLDYCNKINFFIIFIIKK